MLERSMDASFFRIALYDFFVKKLLIGFFSRKIAEMD